MKLQKHILSRILTVMLALTSCISLLSQQFVSAADTTSFDVYMYMVDHILYPKEGQKGEYHTIRYYLDEHETYADYLVENAGDDLKYAVMAWEAGTMSTESVMTSDTHAVEYYSEVLLSILDCSYKSETVISKLNSFVSDGKKVESIYKTLSDLFYYNYELDISEYYNSLVPDESVAETLKSGFMKEMKNKDMILQGDIGAKKILQVLDAAKTGQELIDKFIVYCSMVDINNEMREFLQYVYDNSGGNWAMRTAAGNILYASEDIENALIEYFRTTTVEIGTKLVADLCDSIIDTFISVVPFLNGMMKGQKLGKAISNLLLGTDKIVERYFLIHAYTDIEQLFKDDFNKQINSYKSAPTSEKAYSFMNYLNMLFDVMDAGNEYGMQFADATYSAGILTSLFSNKTQYQKAQNHYNFVKNTLADTRRSVTTMWIWDLEFDNPEMYCIYAPILLENGEIDRIDPVAIRFVDDEGNDCESLEYGLGANIFNNFNVVTVPEEATENEFKFTSSDQSVAYVDKFGRIQVSSAGSCTITATTINEEFSDSVRVTVLETGYGADGGYDGVPVTGFSMTDTVVIDLDVFEFGFIATNFTPTDATNKSIVWTTSDPEVCSAGAFVEGKKPGSAVITATTVDGNFTATCNVIVYSSSESGVASPESNFEYTVSDGKATITKYIGNESTVVIPAKLGGATVTAIGESAFKDKTDIARIQIPESVTSVGYKAFYGCTNLQTINIPKNAEFSSSGYTFYNCKKLKNVVFDSGIEKIPDWLFYCSYPNSNSLTRITIPDTVTSIGQYAFDECNGLTSITIPSSITNIEQNAFAGCSGLTSITIPNSVTKIRNGTFKYCYRLTSVTIPNSVTWIGAGAFEGCRGLTSITIPNSVTEIDNYAFSSTGLTSISLPSSIKRIGNSAFRYCAHLETINIPINAKFGDQGWVFNGCKKLKNVEFDSGIKKIPDYLFYGCDDLDSMTSITIPDTVTSIGERSFCYCEWLKSISIPNSVTSIGYEAFVECKELTSITIPDTVTSIGYRAFSGCTGLTSITIPSSVTSIGNEAFDECKELTSITIPDTVTSIGSRAFYGCTNLTIYGKTGSYAETYAANNKIPFAAISGVTILENPQNTTVIEGLDASLSVITAGSECTYQWQRYTESGWVNLIGETGTTLTINNVSIDKNGYKYRCIVSDGNSSVTSNEAVLTVISSGDVTLDQVKAMTIEELIAFVNGIPNDDSTIILTEAQMYAVEKVLEYDYGRVA